MNSFYKRVFVASLLLITIVVIYLSNILHYITFDQLKTNQLFLQKLVADNYAIAVFCFIGIYIIFSACAFPASAVLTLAGGFLFGTFWGTVYTNIGATIGATTAFLVTRYLIGGLIQARYLSRLEGFNKAIDRYGSLYLLIAHLIIIVPFFVINILAALTTISLWTFIWTTSIGIIPGSLVYAFAGQQLTSLESVYDIFSWRSMVIVSVLASAVIFSLYLKKRMNTVI